MEKDGIKLGRFKNLAILMRDECSVYNNNEHDLSTEYLYSFDLEKGVTMNSSAGPIVIDKIRKTDDDIQVAFAYDDLRKGIKRAYVSLGQEIKIRRVKNDDPEKYIISHCSLMITTKEYAKRKLDDFYDTVDKNKTHTK